MPKVRRRIRLEPYMEIGGWMVFIDSDDADRVQCPECESMNFHVWQQYCDADHMAGACPDCGFEVYDDDPSNEDDDDDEPDDDEE